jgi:uncharacterized protein YqgC (DUF456 family)
MVDKLNTYTVNRPKMRKILGWSLVVLGFVAIVAPIIPGAPIVFVGLELLGLRFLFTDKVKSFFFRKTVPEVAPVTADIVSSEAS